MSRPPKGTTRTQSAAVVIVSFAVLGLAAFATPNARTGRAGFLSYYAGAKPAGSPDLSPRNGVDNGVHFPVGTVKCLGFEVVSTFGAPTAAGQEQNHRPREN